MASTVYNVARVAFWILKKSHKKKLFLCIAKIAPLLARNLANFLPFDKLLKSHRIGVSPLQFVQCPKEGVFFWDSFPNHCENNNNDCDNDNDYFYDIDGENPIKVDGGWCLAFHTCPRLPSGEQASAECPKKVPNRNTCCCHSRIWNYTKRAPLLISISIQGFFLERPCQNLYHIFPRRWFGGSWSTQDATFTKYDIDNVACVEVAKIKISSDLTLSDLYWS